MARPGKYIIVYDISNDRERSKTSKILEGYGIRVQKSAFECRLTKGGREKLLKKLDMLELTTGFVFVYRLNETAKRLAVGKVPGNLAESEPHAFII